MARGIVYTTAAWGHMNPMLGLLRSLVLRGEELTCFGTQAFRPLIEETGCRFLQYPAAIQADRSVSARSFPALRLARKVALETIEALTTHSSALSAEGYDYVLHDSIAPWGKFLARRSGLPQISLVTMFALTPAVVAELLRSRSRAGYAMGDFLKAYLRWVRRSRPVAEVLSVASTEAAAGLDLLSGYGELNLLCTTREFQPFPHILDQSWFFAGPELGGAAPSPPGGSETGVPIVVFSMGTAFQRRAVFETAFEAFAGSGFRGIVVAGGRELTLPHPPANVEVRDWIDDHAVFARAAAFVNHGGIGSLSKAFSHGLPAVVIPQVIDQELVGYQAEALGAAICIQPRDLTAQTLRAAVDRVASEPSHRRAAAELGESFRSAPGMSGAADATLEFLSRRGVR
jgi:MGT family glycosyltransferase